MKGKPPRRGFTPCGAPLAFRLENAQAVPLDALPYFQAEFEAGVPFEKLPHAVVGNAQRFRKPFVRVAVLGFKIVVELFLVFAEGGEAVRYAGADGFEMVFVEVIADDIRLVGLPAEKRCVVALLHAEPELAADVARIMPTHGVGFG